MKKAREETPGPSSVSRGEAILLDLAFLELDMLAHDRIVLLQHQLFRLGARVLLGHVEEAGVGRRVEADLDGGRLGHWRSRAISGNSEACLDTKGGLVVKPPSGNLP